MYNFNEGLFSSLPSYIFFYFMQNTKLNSFLDMKNQIVSSSNFT